MAEEAKEIQITGTKASILEKDASQINIGYVSSEGTLVGKSWSADLEVSCSILEHTEEQVEWLLNTGFGAIVRGITDIAEGIDHKTILVVGMSTVVGITYENQPLTIHELGNIIEADPLSLGSVTLSLVQDTTIVLPINALKVLSTNLRKASIDDCIKSYLRTIGTTYDVSVTCDLPSGKDLIRENSIYGLTRTSSEGEKIPLSWEGSLSLSFAYIHGSPYGSSYGSKNIAHGHTSFVTAYYTDKDKALPVLEKLRSILNNKVFMDNPQDVGDSKYRIEYIIDRGFFSYETGAGNIVVVAGTPSLDNILNKGISLYKGLLLSGTIVALTLSAGPSYSTSSPVE